MGRPSLTALVGYRWCTDGGKEGRVDELDKFVDELRQAKGRCDIPRFSLHDGRAEAKCLFLLKTPSKAALASGYITRENCDVTARNFTRANEEAGLDREDTISWNIVPWYTENADKEVEEALPCLVKLLNLLPKLRVVVLLGETTRKATSVLYRYDRLPDLCVIHAPHPGAQALNRPGKRAYLDAAIRKAARKVH